MVYIFFLVILNELTFKCVIRFSRFVRILEDQWNGKKGSFLKMFNIIKLCVGLKIFKKKDQYDYWVWLFELIFLTLF